MADIQTSAEKKVKILCVFGTRAEATKMVPLVLNFNECPAIDARVCVTAQHRALLDQVIKPFGIIPAYDLNLMQTKQSISDVACGAIKGLENVIKETAPDLLLVHGDTVTTFAGSLAAFYQHVRIGHVEAGLRTYDKYRPYPEEMNRKLTTALADLHFAPTQDAKEKLLKENVPEASIYITGNTAIDLTRHSVRPDYQYHNEAFNGIDSEKRMILMTSHRRENWSEALEEICRAVKRLIQTFPDVTVIWPIHPNPVIVEVAKRNLSGETRVILTEPADVFDMHNLILRSYLVLTDSGGIQEEAAAFKKPVVVMREVTERPEGLKAGTLTLAGVTEDGIFNETARLLTDKAAYERMTQAKNPFGDGLASQRITQAILYEYGLSREQPEPFGL